MASYVYRLSIGFLWLLTIPWQVAVGLLILITSGFPVFFLQKRVGRNGKPFVMYKFRTMKTGSDTEKTGLLSRNESDGPVFKIHDDPRFTRLGRFLSHTGLDELPQLWNVIRGEMALIGPRPLPVAEAEKLAPWMKKRHDILPGIISPAILTGRYHKDFTAWMKNDVAYTKEKTSRRDMIIGLSAIGFLVRIMVLEVSRMVRKHTFRN